MNTSARACVVMSRAAMILILTAGYNVCGRDNENEYRQWKDSTERYSVEAVLVRVENDVVHLRLRNGKKVVVDTTRLSEADREYVRHKIAKHNGHSKQVEGQPGKQPTASYQRPAERKVRTAAQQHVERTAQTQLVGAKQLVHVGAFRVPLGMIGSSTFAFGGTACAYNPANSSLFLVGHDHHQAVAEISIPRVKRSARIEELETARILQPFASVLSRVRRTRLEREVKIGGLLVVNGKLIGTAYEYYDADANARESHFRLSSLDLESAVVEGLFEVGNLGGGVVGGYMAEVPARWQQALGASILTGQSCVPIITRTSSGPCAVGFDAANLGDRAAPATAFVYYPVDRPLRDGRSTNRVFNYTSEIRGSYFDEESGAVLFFGSHGQGDYCYGGQEECNDPVREGKGVHSKGGVYKYQVWAYDARSFRDVRSGKQKPWDMEPYAVWSLEPPFGASNARVGGVAFDKASGRIFVALLYADRVGYDPNPIIHVYKITRLGK